MSEALKARDPLETTVVTLVEKSLRQDERLVAAKDAAHYAMSIVVDSEATRETAERSLLVIVRGKKSADAQRKPVTQTLDNAKKAVMALVASEVDPLAAAESYLSQQIKSYLSRQTALAEAARIAQEVKVEQAVAAGEAPPVAEFVAPPARTTTTDEGSVGLTWKLEVEIERPYDLPEHLIALAPGAKAWVEQQIKSGALEFSQKDEAVCSWRGMRLKWASGLRKLVT